MANYHLVTGNFHLFSGAWICIYFICNLKAWPASGGVQLLCDSHKPWLVANSTRSEGMYQVLTGMADKRIIRIALPHGHANQNSEAQGSRYGWMDARPVK